MSKDRDSVPVSLTETVGVYVVRAGSSSVNVTIGNLPVKARVDSGAEVTILSSVVYKQLKRQPGKVRDVNMQLADNSAVIPGFITYPVAMQLGKQTFQERVYVAPISDDMLLGHDLLHHLGAKIDLKADSLIIKGEKIPLNTTFKEKQPVVARVTVSK